MTGEGGSDLGRAFLEHHLRFHPVDATFMGVPGHDHGLPRADAAASDDERRGIAAFRERFADLAASAGTASERIDARLAHGELRAAEARLDARPRWHNPAWFTGEAIFGLIGLLLPRLGPFDREAIAARLRAVPDFLADGRARLREAGAAPAGWVERARREARAAEGFLGAGIARHEAWQPQWQADAQAAATALAGFAADLHRLEPCSAAAGEAHLSLLMQAQHGLHMQPQTLAARAEAAFARLTEELVEDAARLVPGSSWQEALGTLAARHPADVASVPDRYRHWDQAAREAAAGLVTPADEFELDYRPLAPAFEAAARDLYFLFYRSPPAFRAGSGSTYWVMPPPDGDPASYLRAHNETAIKQVHAVHHGSIGHHTHNARAREAGSLLARVAGTDCASAIAFQSGGMAVEGWACHAEQLLAEAPGFYDAAELLMLKHGERRNAASVLVDIRLHTGQWSPAEAERFYRDEAGFPAARVHNEVVRNTMFPASRLMYWAGLEAIRDLRRRWQGAAGEFHDALLAFGHAPMPAVEHEWERIGLLA